MDFITFQTLVQHGDVKQIVKGLQDLYGEKVFIPQVKKKIQALLATQPAPVSRKKPNPYFSVYFMVKLNFMPSVALQVGDSKSKIRKECYGFREWNTGDRVYFKFDGDSLLEFRVSPIGVVTGRRYFIPRMKKMYSKTWQKLIRLVGRVASEQGIIANKRLVREYLIYGNHKKKLAIKLIERQIKHWFDTNSSHLKIFTRGYEETVKQILQRTRLIPFDDSWYPSRPWLERPPLRGNDKKPRSAVHSHKSSSMSERSGCGVDDAHQPLSKP